MCLGLRVWDLRFSSLGFWGLGLGFGIGVVGFRKGLGFGVFEVGFRKLYAGMLIACHESQVLVFSESAGREPWRQKIY